MAELRLLDLVLLNSHFDMWPPDREAEDQESGVTEESGIAVPSYESPSGDEAFEYPEGDFLQLAAWFGPAGETLVPDGEGMLFVRARIDDEALPFRLDVTLGAQFALANIPDVPKQHLENTLVWLCYPYIREIVSAITTRSPLPAYFLPAITKMPDPSVHGIPPQASDS